MTKSLRLRIGQRLTLVMADGQEVSQITIVGFEKTEDGIDYIDLQKPLGIDPTKTLGYIKVEGTQ